MVGWVRLVLLTALVLTSAAGPVHAQRYCYQIAPGESAARVALRLTGDARNRHASWFQIVDGAWRPLSKDHYDLVHAGWLACLDQELLAATRPIVQRSQPAASLHDPRTTVAASVDFTFLVVGALLVLALWAWRLVIRGRARRQWRAREMRRFGAEFVREFGKPLTEFRGADPPPRARLRMSARRSQLEILLAPAGGRSYPNLSDHRSNVEYDVDRVVSVLKRDAFMRGRPYAEGEWVVLPFQFNDPVNREGVT